MNAPDHQADPKPSLGSARTPRRHSHESNNSSHKSRRGRPRLHLSTEISKQRRRSQIRRAQRAFRERKEDTISTLNGRVCDLENVIVELRKTFSELESSAGISTCSDQFKAQFKVAANRVKTIAESHDEEPRSETSQLEGGSSFSSLHEILSACRQSSQLHNSVDGPASNISSTGSATGSSPEPPESDWSRAQRIDSSNVATAAPWELNSSLTPLKGCFKGPQDSSCQVGNVMGQVDQDQMSTMNAAHLASPQVITQLDAHYTSLCQHQHHPALASVIMTTPSVANIPYPHCIPPDHPLPHELPLPSSYAHTETSFTRRLFRTCLEAAQKLVGDPATNPIHLSRIGRYALCFMGRWEALKVFNMLWSRSATENMENWCNPNYHVGGAGLHFPRVEGQGWDVKSPRPECWDQPGLIGPLPPMGEDAVYAKAGINNLDEYQRIRLAGVEGEWYDANDVEEYLKTKGVFPDASSMVVEVLEPELNMPELSTCTSIAESIASWNSGNPSPSNSITDTSPLSQFVGNLQGAGGLQNEPGFFHSVIDPTLPLPCFETENMKTAIDFDLPFQPTDWNDIYLPPKPATPKKWFDTEAFVTSECLHHHPLFVRADYRAALVNESTCLGRTLCFRKEGVEIALEAATMDIAALNLS